MSEVPLYAVRQQNTFSGKPLTLANTFSGVRKREWRDSRGGGLTSPPTSHHLSCSNDMKLEVGCGIEGQGFRVQGVWFRVEGWGFSI